jgi:hypothetical protein
MTRRINARLPPRLAEKLSELQKRTGKSVTALLQDALENYYDTSRATNRPGEQFADFVGCADGPRALSSTYKKRLRRSLERKV